ncbi:MAG: aminoacyl-tRNA hydrolase, partial [Halanaerobiaceae bacterium]|nr:aminoacyl-tRNA hydrolase [Halanaerobiaceae bacterium]
MFLVVGLGNPGPEYTNTRHNVGCSAIYMLARKIGINSTTARFRAIIGKGSIAEARVILAQPLTYMNNSGEAVKQIVDYYKISIDKIIIISDDMALPTGKIRIKEKGSAGGHNGLKSIFDYLGTQNIPRIRIGIDSPPAGCS